MSRFRITLLLAALLMAGFCCQSNLCLAVGPTGSAPQGEPTAALAAFVKQYCVSCHGAKEPEGKFRLDDLAWNPADRAGLAKWQNAFARIDAGEMPPAESKTRPAPAELTRLQALVHPHWISKSPEHPFPGQGNLVDHDQLFTQPATQPAATPARLWRVSPNAYRRLAESLVPGGGNQVVLPFGLTNDPGFRDYAFRYTISGSETEQMVINAKAVLEYLLLKRPRYAPPKVLIAIADASAPPSEAQVTAAVEFLFDKVLFRAPTAAEAQRYAAFTTSAIAKFGNRAGLVRGLTPVLLHPEAVFRSESGSGQPDAHGRVLLGPIELAIAISYALTDDRPDAELLAAARSGKLATAADVRRETERLLRGHLSDQARVMRFFREYFGYPPAADLFKDEPVLKALNIGSQYRPAALVEDTDWLVAWVLDQDRDVFRQMLTTDRSFVGYADLKNWNSFLERRTAAALKEGVAPQTSPFGGKKNKLNEHYNFPAEQWSAKGMPFELPREQRAGILTQPSWLIAHSTNDSNHAIHRGKWIRERLLGGSIPDTPVTVDAKLPEEPEQTLRHRMRVTRETYCWQCHQKMDPLGLPFEMFDHIGRFRTTELERPVDTAGEIVQSGDKALDGPVSDAVTMIRKLAESERVTQVFVRHAFRYWLGRNETVADAATLQAAHQAYKTSGGSMRALITSLITSDSFLYRYTE